MKLNRNKALAMLASFLILTTAIGIGVWSVGSPSTITITPQSMAKNSSFVISTDGTNFYSVNGTSSELFLQSTNATKVLAFTSGNMTLGGSISVGAGTYWQSHLWNLTYPITVTGAGPATILKLSNSIREDNINTYATCTLRDFTVDGNKANNGGGPILAGIEVRAGSDGTEITNVNVTNVYGGGTVIESNSCVLFGGYYSGQTYEDVSVVSGDFNIINSVVANDSGTLNTLSSFWFSFSSSLNSFTSCVSQGCWQGFGGSSFGGYVANGNSFIDCKAVNSRSDGFCFDPTGTFNNTKIYGCTVNGSGGYGVNIVYPEVTNTVISGNTFLGCASGAVFDAGVGTRRWGNVGAGLEDVALYSYLIYADGSTYYMKNGTTEQVDYSNTNASKVFLFALGNSSFGDTVFVKSGTYPIDTTITMTQGGITLEGESSAGARLVLTTANKPLIKLSAPGTFQYLFTLKNLWLQGQDLAGSIGVLVDSASPGNISDIRYDGLTIQNFARSLIEIRAYGGKTWNHWIENCLLEDSITGYGVYLTNTTGPEMGSIDRVNIYNCHFYHNIHSLYCDSPYVWNVAFMENTVEREVQDSVYSYQGRQWTIQNNKIYDCGNWSRNVYGGIVVNSTLSVGLNASSWIITGNVITNHWVSNCMNYSIWLIGNMTGIIVSNNVLVPLSMAQGTGIKTDGLVWSSSIQLSGNEGYDIGFASDSSPYSYLIFSDGTNYYMRNGSMGRIDYSSTNATLVEQFAVGNLTTSGGIVWLKELQHNTSLTLGNKVMVIESFNGTLRSWSNQGKGFLLSRLVADPDTSGWGDAEAPYWWYNSAEDTIKYWNGTGIVTLPGIGGGGLTYVLPYTYTFYKSGLTYYAQKYEGSLTSSTNISKLAQDAINAAPNPRAISLFFKYGFYDFEYNVTYPEFTTPRTSTFIIQGEGSSYARYYPTTSIGGTVLYFNQSAFRGNYTGTIWNDYMTTLRARDVTFMFYGGGATASGLGIWEGMTTLTMFDHVSLVVLGNYTNSATILFGRGVGAAGTANWHDVVLDEQMTDGNNLQVCYVNYDSFLWSGGDINIKIADAAATPRIFRLEATQGSLVENVASYRDPEKPTPAIYWWYLTPSDDANMHYVFKNFVFYGFDNQTDVTYHFRSTEGVVKVDLNNVGGNGITSLGYKITTGANNIEFYIDHMGKGVIANPVDATGVYLWDWGTGTIANNTIYTNWGSAKTIYVYGGTWASDGGASGQIVVDGTKVCSGTFSNEMLVLQPGDTILFGWQSAPTIVVIGQ